jgi:hypothetical protein
MLLGKMGYPGFATSVYNGCMTKLLEQVLAKVAILPENEQNAIASELLKRLAIREALEREQASGDLQDEPFFGIWKDREDMADSSVWVKTLRQREWPNRNKKLRFVRVQAAPRCGSSM